MGGFPSGQRGQTVNLLRHASVVRIHLRPVEVLDKWNSLSGTYVSKQTIRLYRGVEQPPKRVAADLQSVPFGHSGIRPYL